MDGVQAGGEEAFQDYVAIGWIEFDAVTHAAGLMGREQSGAATAKGVQDNVAAVGTITDRIFDELERFNGGVHCKII